MLTEHKKIKKVLSIKLLYKDCLMIIFSYIEFADILKLQFVCKYWYNVIRNTFIPIKLLEEKCFMSKFLLIKESGGTQFNYIKKLIKNIKIEKKYCSSTDISHNICQFCKKTKFEFKKCKCDNFYDYKRDTIWFCNEIGCIDCMYNCIWCNDHACPTYGTSNEYITCQVCKEFCCYNCMENEKIDIENRRVLCCFCMKFLCNPELSHNTSDCSIKIDGCDCFMKMDAKEVGFFENISLSERPFMCISHEDKYRFCDECEKYFCTNCVNEKTNLCNKCS